MLQISQIVEDDAINFTNKLRYLINTTIKLPAEALDYYNSAWTLDYINQKSNDFVFLKAVINDEIVGVLVGTSTEGGVATIIWVLVDSDFVGKKIGTKLFEKAKAIYKKKNAHKIKLTVPDFKTVDFYTKQGMILEGIHKNHWFKSDFWSMGINI